MFELTNQQRICFALPTVSDCWDKVEVKKSRYDNCTTYAYLDGQNIVKVVQISEVEGQESYFDFGVDEMISYDRSYILPKTTKGKPQMFTSNNLIKRSPVGMSLLFFRGYISVVNHSTEQCFYRSNYNGVQPHTLLDFEKWVNDWCEKNGKKELEDIAFFSKSPRVHQKFKEGDIFRYRINRNLFGYGRIMVDYAMMRKNKIPFWDMSPPLVSEWNLRNPKYKNELKLIKEQMGIK